MEVVEKELRHEAVKYIEGEVDDYDELPCHDMLRSDFPYYRYLRGWREAMGCAECKRKRRRGVSVFLSDVKGGVYCLRS